MSDTYQITITTTSKETFTGKMKRSQPELVNVTYGTASGSVTKDIKVSVDLINVTQADDGSVTNPVKYYTFYFNSLTGTDVNNTPANATVNTTKFILNDNQALAAGPFFSPLAGSELWIHFMAQLGDGEGAYYKITLWSVYDDNSQVPGTTQTLTGIFLTAAADLTSFTRL
ncbi:hypothetical protein HF650_06515 [Kosakonia sp. SMBL-WEM22]|uniref:hypothetical protein n=1 Tax=Kosakonia sp. SMBL-WEM22 TaxID=2725560 RepID=UPI00165949C1|nr:hypothetical protein [Kosakonia sp. SMBL-WEM22]QNQ18286.1 hypothetical protein HF650_06515 [Kosakonia sp. SMBL-WEM22]